jgi:hypothetical protein
MSQGLTGVPQAPSYSASVASATTVTLPNAPMDCTYPITGTNTITGITAGQAGRKARLIFQSANCTVVNGSNLKLAGRSFISTAMRTLTLVSDGTNWVETSRGNFGTTLPVVQNFGDVTAAGSVGESADVAHVHGMPAYPSFNALVNGDFAFTQTGLTSNPLVNGQRNFDDWGWYQIGDGLLYQTRIDGQGGSFIGAVSMSTYTYINVITARTTSAAGDYYLLQQFIEGWDARHLINGCAFSGWFNTTLAGTYCFVFRNRVSNPSYVHPVTLAANVWTPVTFVVPAMPSVSGNMRDNIGLIFTICLAAGSTWQTTADSWNAGAFFATSAQVNFPATLGAQIYMHALNLVPGSVPQPFVPLPYEQELARVMRHRQVLINGISGDIGNGS